MLISQWYMTEGEDRLSIRIRSGLCVGEHANGFLSLDDAREYYQWLRFYQNEHNELWITCLHDFFIESHLGKFKEFQLLNDTKIQLIANEIYVCRDPFQISDNATQITIKSGYQQQASALHDTSGVKAPRISKVDLHSTGFFRGEQHSSFNEFQAFEGSNEADRTILQATTGSIDALNTSHSKYNFRFGSADDSRVSKHYFGQQSDSLPETWCSVGNSAEDFPMFSGSQYHIASTGVANYPVGSTGQFQGRKTERKKRRPVFLFAGTTIAAVISVLLLSLYVSGHLSALMNGPLQYLNSNLGHSLSTTAHSNDSNEVNLPRQTESLPTKKADSDLGDGPGSNSPSGSESRPLENGVIVSQDTVPDATGKNDPASINKIFTDEDWRIVRARNSLLRGEIIAPKGRNAVAYLQSYLVDYPDSEVALNLLRQCASQLINLALEQHQSGNMFEARNTLEEVLVFDQNNERANLLWNVWRG